MIFQKQRLLFLWIGIISFIAAFVWSMLFKNEANTLRYKKVIENYLQIEEVKADKILEDKDFIQKLLINNPNTSQELLNVTEKLKQEKFALAVYRNREVIYWTRNDVVPQPDSSAGEIIYNKTFTKFVKQDVSQYEQRRRTYKANDSTNVTIIVLIPIKKAFKSFEGKYLHAFFPASGDIPSQLILDTASRHETLKYAITTGGNAQNILCYLKSDEAAADETHDMGMFLFFIIGFMCIGFFGDDLAKQLLKHYKQPTIGITFFLFFAGLLRIIIYLIQTRAWLPTLKISVGDSAGIFISSLPQLWIDTLFCFWIAIFLNRHLVIAHSANLEIWKRAILSPIYYIVIVWLNISAIGIFDDLVTTSTGIITFDSLTEFNLRSVSALCAVSIFMFSVFLISERMVRLAGSLNLSPAFQISAAIEACLLGWVTFEMLNLHHDLPNWVYVSYISAYIIFMHLFVMEKRPTIVWLVTWLVLFSFAESFFIAHFNEVKEKSMFVSYAKRLSVPRDSLAERYILILKRSIENDPIIKAGLMSDEIREESSFIKDDTNLSQVTPVKDSSYITQSATINMDRRIHEHFDSISYLNSHYDFNFFGFRRNGVAVIQEQEADLKDFKAKHDAGIQIGNSKRLHLWSSKDGDWAYLDYAEIAQARTPDNPIQIAMKITRNDKVSGVLSSELLSDNNFKGMKDLSLLEYGIYKNGKRTEPNFTGVKLILNKDEIPPPDSSVFFQDNEKRGVIYRSHDGTIVKISRDNVVSSQTLALCAFIIIVWAFLLFLMAVVNNYLSFLPPFMNFSLSLSYNRSFSNRLMLPLIAFLFASYIIIFYFNLLYTEETKETLINHELNLKYEPIVSQLFEQIAEAPTDSIGSEASKISAPFLNKILQKYAQTNETALHIYDTNGYLLATTETNLFDKGLVSRFMDAAAYRKLSNAETNSSFKADERIGNFHYKTNYYNIWGKNKKLLGFLETPLYSGDRNLKLSAYASRSSNLFYLAILFLLGILAVYEITKLNMRPIKDIAEKLKRMTIGNKAENERIEWSRNDEIGVVVNAYNNKIEELKDSFEKISEAERAMAWKSMAQHVAHEIRNPLTPIKMVVSHLSFIKDVDDATFKEIALRSAQLILDQVETLERITNEFAFFAKMPQNANNSAFELNELISSVTTLFISGNNDKNIKILISLPEAPLFIYADKNHLLGAFNNLIKNAIQAIPSDRPGVVRVSLYPQKTKAIVRISDNGVGIPKDATEKIFGQNFTTKLQGSGIGLYYTKQIIQSAGGKIYFDSVEDIGTDFFVELDIYDSAVEVIENPADVEIKKVQKAGM